MSQQEKNILKIDFNQPLDIRQTLAELYDRLDTYLQEGNPGLPMSFYGQTLTGASIKELIGFLLNWLRGAYKLNMDKVSFVKGNKKLSGLLMAPNEAPEDIPLICYQHGTQIMREFAPSQFKKIMERFIWDWPRFYDVFLAAWVAHNGKLAVLMPDYPGMGDDIDINTVQPYEIAEPLAEYVLDLLSETIDKEMLSKPPWNRKWNNRLFLMGYSQGGYATMAVARKYMAKYQTYKNYPLIGCAPMGGPYSISEVTRDIMVDREKDYPMGYFLPMTIRAYSHWCDKKFRGLFDRDHAFKFDNKGKHIWDLADGFHTFEEVQAKMENLVGKKIGNLLNDSLRDALLGNCRSECNTKDEVFKYLQEQDTFENWSAKEYSNSSNMQMRLYHAKEDEIVFYEHAVIASKALLEEVDKGLKLDIKLEPVKPDNTLLAKIIDTEHARAAFPCCQEALNWFDTLGLRT